MNANEIRRYFAYNSWANEKTFDALAGFPVESYRADMKSSHGGVHGTMLHIIWAQHLWLLRWMGRPHDAASEGKDRAVTLDGLRTYWLEVDGQTRTFLDGLTDGFIGEIFTMKNTKGDSFTHTYGEAMLHLVNHSSYHRGQVAALLRQAGHKPPGTDFIVYARQYPPEGVGR